MSKWMNEIDLADLQKHCDEGTLSVYEIGKQIAARLRKVLKRLKFPRNYQQRQEIREELDDIAYSLEHIDEKEDFESVINWLYDVADTDLGTDEKFHERPKLLWVKTF